MTDGTILHHMPTEIIRPSDSNRPDSHGQAAMLLVESLIHEMVARSLLSVADAVEVVRGASDVMAELAREPADAWTLSSLTLLDQIGESLQNDLHPQR